MIKGVRGEKKGGEGEGEVVVRMGHKRVRWGKKGGNKILIYLVISRTRTHLVERFA